MHDAGTLNGFPLWARIWPASLVLAEMVASMPADRRRQWIEIGGGLGQVSIVAAACGHRITFSEANPHALAFARASAELNGLPQLPVVPLDWGERSAPGPFDVVIGSEVVYRDADIAPLQGLFARLLKPGGEVILAGEVRRVSDAISAADGGVFPRPGPPETAVRRAARHDRPRVPLAAEITELIHLKTSPCRADITSERRRPPV